MTLIEFIGFLAGLIGFFFLLLKRVYDDLYRKRNPAQRAAWEKKKRQEMRELLKRIEPNRKEDFEEEEELIPLDTGLPTEKRPPRPPVPPIVSNKYRQQAPHLAEEPHHKDAYAFKRKESGARISRMVYGLSSPKNMVLFKEIIDKPLALRED